MSPSRLLHASAIVASLAIVPVPAHADTDQSEWLTSVFKAPRSGARSGGNAKSSSSASYGGTPSSQSGVASYYWQPQAVASGGQFNPNALTAAHKTLPFGSRVRVTNMNNGRSVEVVINDRGPYVAGRVIDLSRRAAQQIGMTNAGVARVAIERL